MQDADIVASPNSGILLLYQENTILHCQIRSEPDENQVANYLVNLVDCNPTNPIGYLIYNVYQ